MTNDVITSTLYPGSCLVTQNATNIDAPGIKLSFSNITGSF